MKAAGAVFEKKRAGKSGLTGCLFFKWDEASSLAELGESEIEFFQFLQKNRVELTQLPSHVARLIHSFFL